MASPHGATLHACNVGEGDRSLRIAMRLAQVELAKAVRWTGGVGKMDFGDIAGLTEMTEAAFAGFRGAVLGGGTQLRLRRYPFMAQMGVTEMLPVIQEVAPKAAVIGITPRLSDLKLIPGVGAMVADGTHSDGSEDPYITIVHPQLNECLLLQYSADTPLKSWSEEWKMALRYLNGLRNDPDRPFATAHIIYNGGQETERELLALMRQDHEANNPWLTFLIADSGRVATQYAEDATFCTEYAERLVVCGKSDFAARFRAWTNGGDANG